MASDAEGTFAHQDSLPPLPVPPLDSTMEAYLQSARPFLSEQELEHTRAVIADFQAGVGAQLQEQLEAEAEGSRNWLYDYWETLAYLQPRYPSAVNVNWHGVLPGRWGSSGVTQAETAALFADGLCEMRRQLINGTFPVDTMAGQKLCMHQYSRMFNSCVVPHEGCDELEVYELDSDVRHCLVLRNNAMFLVDVLDAAGNTLPMVDLVAQFERVRDEATGLFDLSRNPPVATLSSENRDTWARAREHLRQLDPRNAEALDAVQRALFVISLDERSPTSDREMANIALYDSGCFYDKAFTLILCENTKGGLNGQHMWADAITVVQVFDRLIRTHLTPGFAARYSAQARPTPGLPGPRRIEWVLDAKLETAIETANANLATLAAQGELNCLKFTVFGKSFLKRYRCMPDLFVQQAIQLAYRRLHGHATAVYESAHTRLFYRGRTDTIRSCSDEAVAFQTAMLDPAASDGDKWDKLQAAMEVHKQFAQRCLTGRGVDRHLMGLQIMSEMSGADPKPAFFTDKAFTESKRYVLSTSNISGGGDASPIWGGFSAMTEDGYGVCYGIVDNYINFSISCYKSNPIRTEEFKAALQQSLIDMRELCLTRNVMYMARSNL